MYQFSPGIGAGSNYLGYVPASSITTSKNLPGIGAGSNYLGYASPDSVYSLSGKPFWSAWKGFSDQVSNTFENFYQTPDQKPDSSFTTSSGVSGSGLQPSTFDYFNADLAQRYGMSRETAYQEALSNTSYQRAIRDMQAAGLNPAAIFGSGKASGADGVSYVSSAAPSGAGGSSGKAVSKNKDNLFSSGAYYGLSAGIGLLAGILTKSPTGYWIGSQASQGFLGAANAVYKSMK